jgi:hypothetical protein
MTNLEAADLLDNLIGMVSDNHDSDYDEALRKGRDILKSEPCEDCICRQTVLEGKVIHQSCDGIEIINSYAVPVEYIEQLPSVQPKTMQEVEE